MEKLSLKANLLWNSMGSFVYLICQWLLTLLVVRFSNGFNNAGYLTLAISVTNIFYNLACFNVRPFLVSDIKREYEIEDYVTFRLVTCIIATILCFLYILFFNYTVDQLICIMLFMIYKIGEAIVDLFHAFEQRKSRMDIGGISLFCRGIISLTSFFVALKLGCSINIAIVFMIIFTYIFIFFYDYRKVKIFEDIKIHFNKKKIYKLFISFFPLAIGSFLGTTSTSLPRQYLETILGTESLGIYGTVATPAVIVQVASSYIYNPLLVSFAENLKFNKKNEFINLLLKTTIAIIGISILCLVGSCLFSELGLTILYGEKIASYSYLFVPIIIYTSLNGLLWFYHNILIIFRKMNVLLIINLVGFLTCLFFSTTLIHLFGMNGVSYSLILFTLIMIILMIIAIIINIRTIGED